MDHQDLLPVAQAILEQEAALVEAWLDALRRDTASAAGRIPDAELQNRCRSFVRLMREGMLAGGRATGDPAFARLRDLVGDFSRGGASLGFTPTETALFIFSLKEALFELFGREAAGGGGALWAANALLDRLALHSLDVYQRSREEVIVRQQREIGELSTPVVKLWDGVLGLPLIGTLDSERTQVVMENLLQAIVDNGAEVAIIDITGVPMVDTLVAQHLLKTIAAARLMGAECIVSGIRPQIAQTIVHLGVQLDVLTKASLADALQVALRRIGFAVTAADAAPAGRRG